MTTQSQSNTRTSGCPVFFTSIHQGFHVLIPMRAWIDEVSRSQTGRYRMKEDIGFQGFETAMYSRERVISRSVATNFSLISYIQGRCPTSRPMTQYHLYLHSILPHTFRVIRSSSYRALANSEYVSLYVYKNTPFSHIEYLNPLSNISRPTHLW